MLDLRNFFKNHFDTREVSDDNLHKFAEDHLGRLTAHNTGGKYAALIATTTTLHNKFFTCIKQEDQAFTSQQSKTKQTDTIMSEFLAQISRKEGAVRSEFGKDSPEYQEFFPAGLTEYHAMTKSNAELLMERIVSKAKLYEDTLGTKFLQIFTDLLESYQTAREIQLTTMGDVDRHKSDAAQAREELTTQLAKNLLLIAAEYIGQPERLSDFFSQEIVRRKITKDDGTVADTVPANTTQVIESQGITDATEITFTNTGNVPLRIGRSTAENTLPDDTSMVVQVGKGLTVKASGLGVGNYLNVKNSTDQVGAYEVLLL